MPHNKTHRYLLGNGELIALFFDYFPGLLDKGRISFDSTAVFCLMKELVECMGISCYDKVIMVGDCAHSKDQEDETE